MSYCKSCGKNYPDTVSYCSKCGTQLEEGTNPNPQTDDSSDSFINNLVGKAKAAFDSFNNTPDTTDSLDSNDISSNKVMAILAYFSWLVLIPLFVARDSKFARYHCNQGIVLAIAELVVGAIHVAVSLITLGFLEWLWSLIFGLIGVVFTVLSIIGIVNAATGKAKELPLVGKYRILK